jgi:hypothetical protein
MVILARDRLHQALRGLHHDEGGMEALQVVLIVAIAASILIIAYRTFWTGEIKVDVAAILKEFKSVVSSTGGGTGGGGGGGGG